MSDQEPHKLGEVLRTAREAKGVDLPRVERETKIRTRYLTALENGDYRELPGAVYTKGFLRNYGAYLGLDADYLVDLYRLESSIATAERPSVPSPPRPIGGRRSRALVVTPGALLAAVLTVGVALFIVYLVSEFVTFAGTPELRILEPAGDVSGYQGDEYTFEGVTEPNSRVSAETATRKIETTADAEGSFEITVPLVPGSNVVTLIANDPVTGRNSAEHVRTILVGDGPSPSLAPTPALELAAPEEGATLSGPVAITGRAAPDATVTITATPTGATPATFRVVTLGGEEVPVPSTTPSAPPPMVLTAGPDGAFEGTMSLPPAAWRLTIAAEGDGGEELARSVTVAAPEGLVATLRVSGSPSYVEIDQDGVPMPAVSGRNAQPGAEIELSARETLRVRVGNAAAVTLVINGVELGPMGGQGDVVEWRISPV